MQGIERRQITYNMGVACICAVVVDTKINIIPDSNNHNQEESEERTHVYVGELAWDDVSGVFLDPETVKQARRE